MVIGSDDLFCSDSPWLVLQNPSMPGSEFRTKAAECGLLALDASRTETQRAESHLQQTLWLKMAHEADENDDARRLRIALRATK